MHPCKTGGGGAWGQDRSPKGGPRRFRDTPPPAQDPQPPHGSAFPLLACSVKLRNAFPHTRPSPDWRAGSGTCIQALLPSGAKGSLGAEEERLMTSLLLLLLQLLPPAPPSPLPFPIKRLPHSYFCLLTACDLWHLFGCE